MLDRFSRAPSVRDRRDDQIGPTDAVAAREDVVDAGRHAAIGLDRAARADADAEAHRQPVPGLDADEADRDQHEVDVEQDVLHRHAAARTRLGPVGILDALRAQVRDVPVPAPELEGLHLPVAFATLLVRGVRAHKGGPLGPRAQRLALARRRGAVGDLDDRQRALADHVAEAVGGGIAAAQDRDALAPGRRCGRIDGKSRDPAVLCDQVRHREVHAVELASRQLELTMALCAGREHERVVARAQLVGGDVDAALDAARERDALGLELLDPQVDCLLVELEVGDAVAQEPARPIVALVHRHGVAGARELLGAGEARRARADDADAAPGRRLRGLGDDPALVAARAPRSRARSP